MIIPDHTIHHLSGTFKSLIYYSLPYDEVFDIFTISDLQEMFQEQMKYVREEADILKSNGFLSETSYNITIEQYQYFYYYEGYFYKKSDIQSYVGERTNKESTIVGTTITKQKEDSVHDTYHHELPINQHDTNKPTTIEEARSVSISREAIRNLTGYSPYFTPTLWEGPTTYVKWQDDLIKDESRIILVLGSRQTGKSLATAERAIEESFKPGQNILVGAFRTASTDNIRNYIRNYTRDIGIFEEYRGERYFLNKKTYSKIYFRTLSEENDAVEAVRGMTLNLVIVDEAQLVSEYAYEEILRPTLSTTQGRLIMLGTPPRVSGSYFIDMIFRYKRGLIDASYYEIKLTDQPFTDPEMRAEMMARSDEPRIQREWFCNIHTESGTLFKVDKVDKFPNMDKVSNIIIGIDPARRQDQSGYAVGAVIGGQVILIESGYVPKSMKKSWGLQATFYKKIIQKYSDYLVDVVIDSSGVGDGVVEIFRNAGIKLSMTVRYTSGMIKRKKGIHCTVSKSILIQNKLDFISEGFFEVVDVLNKDYLEEVSYIEEVFSRSGLIGMKSNYFDDATNATMIMLFLCNEKNLLSRSMNTDSDEVERKSGIDVIDAIEGRKENVSSVIW